MPKITADQLDALLPQTQCQLCEFDGCRPYAEAIVDGKAPINRCLPGGIPVLEKLATLMQQDASDHIAEMANNSKEPSRVIINEASCIGCTKCIDACPTDAILGSGKKMHTVIADACTGCELCLPPCPVDCIDIIATPEITKEQSGFWRQRHDNKNNRLKRLAKEAEERYQQKLMKGDQKQSVVDRQKAMADALARVKSKKKS